MDEIIQLLIIDDYDARAHHVIEQLQQENLKAEFRLASTAERIRQLLSSHYWDVIIANIDFSGLKALQIPAIVGKLHEEVPLLVIGENVTEDIAVKVMEAGAQDCIDISRTKQLVQAIKRELKRKTQFFHSKPVNVGQTVLSFIVKHTQNEIYITDTTCQRIAYANDTALKNMGYTQQEINQRTPAELYSDLTEISFLELLLPLKQGQQNFIAMCTRQKKKDGSLYTVETHLRLFRQTNHARLIITSRDISERKKQSAILRKQKSLSGVHVRRSKRKSDLLTNITHELRTDLNSITLLSQLLHRSLEDEDNLPHEQLEYANTIHDLSTHLLELVNDLLDLSKITSGKKKPKIEEIHIRKLCEKLSQIFLPISREKNIAFCYNISSEGPEVIYSDSLFVERILKNLLSNAFKFTEQGRITLDVCSASPEELRNTNVTTSSTVAFKVKDTGIGIPDQKQSQIFNRFQQANESTKDHYGGTGLGLAICQKLSQLIGGDISLNSTVGEGSTFTFYLPSNKIVTHQLNSPLKARNTSSFSSKPLDSKKMLQHKIPGTVLLGDDSEIHNMALKEFLNYHISQCLTATSARQIYKIIEEQKVDCLVLDMSFPDTNGYEVMANIKNREECTHIPIIIHSGKKMSQQERQKLRQYADHIIEKNVDSYKLLLEKITSLLKTEK